MVVAVVVVAGLSIGAFLLLSAPQEPRAARLDVTSSNPSPVVGQAVSLTVEAVFADGTTATNYRGEVAFTSDDPLAELPTATRFEATDQGVRQFPGVTIRKTESVTITVRDAALGISGSVILAGQPVPAVPTAAFTATRTLMTVDVNASASTDPENDLATYAWDWGDGMTSPPSATPLASHDYTTPNVYTITLTVTDLESNQDTESRKVTVGPSTLDVEIFDLMNVPFREIWDWRTAFYGDLPIGADCFSFDSIPGGAGSPNPAGSGVCDVRPTGYTGETWLSSSYMNWYPWYADRRSSILYAPYRIDMAGRVQPGSTLAEPVILPVLNPAEAAGTTLRVRWDMDYISFTRADELDLTCGSGLAGGYDGFHLESIINITLDTQESRRIFGVTGDPATWWAANSDPDCSVPGQIESRFNTWIATQGGRSALSSGIGPYDVASSFEYWYASFLTNFESATVDPVTGLTNVRIQHVAWGTEILLARWFYWGQTFYNYAGPDGLTGTADDIPTAEIYPHNNTGWWEWELGWFEEFAFNTSIGATSQDFTLNTVMQYHFAAYANPGPDGIYDATGTPSADDIAVWHWQPVLTDYIYGGTAQFIQRHTVSELDPYAGPDGRWNTTDDLRYRHGIPGSVYYGRDFSFEYVPKEWDLKPGDTVTFRLPTGVVKFIDPYSPRTSGAADLITFDGRIEFFQSTPSLPVTNSELADSNADGLVDRVLILGPIDWGAPDMPLAGSPALQFRSRPTTLAASASDIERLGIQAEVGGTSVPTGTVGHFVDAWQAVPRAIDDSARFMWAAVRSRI